MSKAEFATGNQAAKEPPNFESRPSKMTLRPKPTDSLDDRLRYIVKEMREVGFDTGLDIFRAQLKVCYHKDRNNQITKRDFESVRCAMVEGPFVEFLKVSGHLYRR